MNPTRSIMKEGTIQKTGGIGNPDEGVAIGFFLRGDFDGDREITDKDGAIVSANYGGSNKTYSQGDSDYDGDVDFTDLLYVSQRNGVVLAEPPTAPGQLVAYTATLNDPAHEMKLDWTAPEAEFDGFKITRSTDSINFEEIADVDARCHRFVLEPVLSRVPRRKWVARSCTHGRAGCHGSKVIWVPRVVLDPCLSRANDRLTARAEYRPWHPACRIRSRQSIH